VPNGHLIFRKQKGCRHDQGDSPHSHVLRGERGFEGEIRDGTAPLHRHGEKPIQLTREKRPITSTEKLPPHGREKRPAVVPPKKTKTHTKKKLREDGIPTLEDHAQRRKKLIDGELGLASSTSRRKARERLSLVKKKPFLFLWGSQPREPPMGRRGGEARSTTIYAFSPTGSEKKKGNARKNSTLQLFEKQVRPTKKMAREG